MHMADGGTSKARVAEAEYQPASRDAVALNQPISQAHHGLQVVRRKVAETFAVLFGDE